jgi:hypothetical protein
MMKTKQRPSKARPALGAEVVADHIRFGRVINCYGDTVVVNFEVPNWPFPMTERRRRSDIALVDQMPDLAHLEEALF